MFLDDSLLSDDSSDDHESASLLSPPSATPLAKKQRVAPRRSFNISADLLCEAIRNGGCMDGDEACATLADISQYLALKREFANDRAFKNAIYQKLRNAKDIEKRDELLDGMKRPKVWFYIRSNQTPPTLAFSGDSRDCLSPSAALSMPLSAPPPPTNDCTRAHRHYFHLEAVQRGLKHVNAVLRRLCDSTGLGAHFGDLEIAVLAGKNRTHRDFPVLKSWHDKYDRMKAVFNGAEDGRVDGFRFVLVLYRRSVTKRKPATKITVVEPISVGSITAHRVYNKPDNAVADNAEAARHWHVELEIQTLLVPVAHQGRGIGTVMQRSMYLLAQGLAAEPDPPVYDESGGRGRDYGVVGGWSCVKSGWIGRRIVRKVYDRSGYEVGMVRGVVESWLPAAGSNFKNVSGAPAALWRVRYTTRPLEGVIEDLEEHELVGSVDPVVADAAVGGASGKVGTPPFFGKAVASFLVGIDKEGNGARHVTEQPKKQKPRPMNRAERMDTEEATNISMQRITCVTTVYLDDMAKKFYLKNDMKEMLPPYDDGMRRNSNRGAALRQRIWDNCDHKRLHWWYNTIYGSSFSGNETPEESLKLALKNTVDRCQRGEEAHYHPSLQQQHVEKVGLS